MAETNLFNAVYNPDVLSCLANLSNDEVFTPPDVVKKMLDMLPQELFRNPDTTFLDPACKTGVFLREIAKRLITGLEAQFPDLQERIDHIFHKQLYGIAITELTSLLSRRGVYCSKYPNGEYSVTQFDDAEGNVASCQAMANLLGQRQNSFYHDYKIIVCAGTRAGIGLDALAPVQAAMGDPLATKTITLSCGKLTTGVTIRPWTGIFMLRNLKSPETYFQAAFRVQSPWEIKGDSGERIIMKQECYVFDFALDRALRQISDYSCRLDVNEGNPEKKVAEFINFLPVLAYDGSTMRQINAQDVLDIAMAGTSATLLAKRWESALLVNVDNDTLTRLMNNKDALEALMHIEGFRSLNTDIQTIINKSEAVKKAKKDGDDKLTPKEKKELTEDEKEYKSMRKQIQEKLIKFATRVPVFMYLTDCRERSLRDVITQLEPSLFKKVTGLDVKDFELLCSIGVFNASLMNDAIFKFKRYEDSSLTYTGIDKHESKDIGGWDTVIKREEFERLFYNQQSTMEKLVEQEELKDVAAPATEPKQSVAPTPVKQPLVTEAYGVKKPDVPKAPISAPVQKPQETALDLSSVKVGTPVTHKGFGAGTVTWIFVLDDRERNCGNTVFRVLLIG